MARILVIDDMEMLRNTISELLLKSGYEVQEAPDGQAGLELHRKDPVDLVITDIAMPKKNGLEVIAELRQTFPETKIIAITAYIDEYLAKIWETGIDRIFQKPFQIEELLKAVKEVLGEN